MRTMKQLALHLLQAQPDVQAAMLRGVSVFVQNRADLDVDFNGPPLGFAYSLYNELIKVGRRPSKSTYFTPLRIAKKMCEEAGVAEGDLVFDPCAGLGCLLATARTYKAKVFGFEVQPWLTQVVKLCRDDLYISCRNFLREPDGVKSFVMPSTILFNPPMGPQQGCADITVRMLGRIAQLYYTARLVALLPGNFFDRIGKQRRTRSLAVQYEVVKCVELPDGGRIEEFAPWTAARFAIFELNCQPE